MTTWRIGDAAALLGVPTHVLRHWEEVGALEPARLANGHRVYDDETITRARLIRLCQRAGMSLTEIGDLYRGDGQRRAALVRDRRDRIADQIRQLHAAQDFLDHVLACAHPVVSTCPECSSFAAGQREPRGAVITPVPRERRE
ncbi:MerR family transcriptional regulator [Micromonospora mangrovi]|uniref:MerR family transcriptional regulator n=2 Tax=Micromonospora TaxID=1873 RepID=A0AAU8HF76_9ACTN